MKRKNLDLKGAVCAILDEHKVNAKVRSKFINSKMCTMEPFLTTMKIILKREELAEKRFKQINALKA